MITRKNLIYSIILLLGIVVLINILGSHFFFRLDFTEDQRYTLSDTTVDIIEDLEEPVTVTAYFSEGLQPQFDQMRRDFKDLLAEYAGLSGKMIVYEFINPNESEELEQKAVQAGVQPLIISSREKNQSVQKKAFLGAVIQMGEESEVLPFVQPGAQMEYALTTSLKKLTVLDKPLIGFISGHGEAELSSLQQVKMGLDVLYQSEQVELNDSVELSKYKSLAWIGPKDSIPAAHLKLIDDYLDQGGNLFVAIDQVKGDFSQAMGLTVFTGMDKWLQSRGFNIENNFVLDANCGTVSVQQQMGPFPVQRQISFPYLPVISNFAVHPITEGLSGMPLQFASSISFNGDSAYSYTPLAFTSEKSGTQSVPVYFNVEKKWTQQDLPLSGIIVSALVEGAFGGSISSKIVVITDADFIVNGSGQQMRQVQPDNANFVVNSIDFMSDDTGLINLRAKKIKNRPIEQIEDDAKNWYKTLNFILPILLIIAIGLFRYQRKRFLRLKRMEEDYV